MATVESIRKENLRVLLDQWGGPTSLAKKLKHSGPSYLSQLVTGKRPISEKTARKFETQLKLDPGWLDSPHGDAPGPVPVSIDLMMQVITKVGTALEGAGIHLPPSKFADVVAMAYERMQEAGTVDDAWLARVIKLAK